MKNCRRIEERFTREYFDQLEARARDRARRWTQARFGWEMKHSGIAEAINWVLVLTPLITAFVIWEMALWRT